MSLVSFRRSRVRTFLVWAAALTWLGCGGGGTDVVLPSLSVTTSTQGVELDPDGYTLLVDGSQDQPIGATATLVIERLADGEHTLELSGLAANCSAGENPRTITIRSGATTSVAFGITCSATSASIEVGTTTAGAGSDPDGFALMLDGAAWGPIGVSSTANLDGLAPGIHSVGLTGIAGNCQVTGENPRSVDLASGQTAQVAFSVTCVAPGPAPGSITVTTSTTGPNQDADGYSVSVDDGAPQPIGATGSLTLTNMPSSAHTVGLAGIASNCVVTGANPRSVTVVPGQAATVAFAITCTAPPPESGSIRVTVSTSGGSPDPDGYSLTIDGGSSQSLGVNGNRTIQNLAAGAHSAQLGGIAGNCSVAGANPQNVTVVAGQTATVTFTVTCVATGPSVNLRIERVYLTQSTQRLSGNVPLVQGRDALLRAFVTASGSNSARPNVRIRVFQGGSLARTLTITPTRNSTPTSVEEQTLASSWNVIVPGSLIGGNTSVLADVDPDNTIAETDEADNNFPASGPSQALTVQSAPAAAIRFVPILQTANNLRGSANDPGQLLDLARRLYPLNSVSADVRAEVFTVSGPLQPFNDNDQWNQVVFDLEALRIADGATDRTYYGLVRLNYGAGMVGNGLLGAPAAIGTDNPSDVRRIIAHELGHTWGQLHTPSCGPDPRTIDPRYPYGGGNIGVYGYDMRGGDLKAPSLPDIMGYCENPWISDYIYERVLGYRRSNPLGAATATLAQPCLLVWGRIENGRAVLEPSFQIMTRPHLPRAGGPYSLEATTSGGTRLFGLTFDAVQAADDPRGAKHFAFAIPLDQARAAELGSIRLSGPGIQVMTLSQSARQLARSPAAQDVSLRREMSGLRLQWNPALHPMILVRDPESGRILSFARGGDARVETAKNAVDLQLSDGVKSYRLRRAISR